jgi:sigma-B regulation protein RsbU (phosphoserine phosphatase)
VTILNRQTAPARPADRSRFELYHDQLTHSWASVVVILGAVLVPLFVVLDRYALERPLFYRFAMARGVFTALVFAEWLVIKLTRPSRWSFVHGYVFTTLVGGVITWMTVELGGFDSSYWPGLTLVILTNLLMPWRTGHAIANSTAILAMYVVANAIWGGPFQGPYLAQSLFFMGATCVIAVVTASARYTLIVREFNATTELVDANASLERSRAELKTARDALWGEMEVAKRIQTSLLPENRRVGGYEVAARMSPAAEVGGDYYDIIQAGEDRNWLAIGDVSGHGVESGLVMMMTQTSILSLVRENDALSPADVFSAVNDVLLENISRLHSARYMTLNVVRLADRGLTLAGKHQDVLVWRKAMGAVETVSNEGCWIGVVDDTRGRVTDQTIAMDVGDVALFFTDGATEAMNAKSEMYGEDRLGAVLASVAEKPLDEALEVLFAEIAAFRAVQDDDVTMMLVRRAPDAGAVRPRDPTAARRSSAA